MNYDSDENDDVASFLLCSVFYCLCVVYCVASCIVSVCLQTIVMSIVSLHVVNIFLT